MVTEQINYTKRDAAAEQKRAPDLDSQSPRSDSWLSHHVALHNKFLNSVSLPFFACKKGFHNIYFTTLLKKGKYTIATQEMVITFDSVKAVTFFFLMAAHRIITKYSICHEREKWDSESQGLAGRRPGLCLTPGLSRILAVWADTKLFFSLDWLFSKLHHPLLCNLLRTAKVPSSFKIYNSWKAF